MDLLPHLGLHERTHYSDYSRKNYATFDAHLGLHHVPGHSRDRRRRIRRRWRRRRIVLRGTDRQPPSSIAIVVAILRTPRRVHLLAPSLLTRCLTTRPLSHADAHVRQEPSSADRTRALLLQSPGTIPAAGHSGDRRLSRHYWVIFHEQARVISDERCSRASGDRSKGRFDEARGADCDRSRESRDRGIHAPRRS